APLRLVRGTGRRDEGRPDRVRRWAMAGTAAAAAAAIAALAVSLVNSNDQVGQLQSALGGHVPDAAVRAALASPGHRLVDLRTTGGTQQAELVLERRGTGYVVTSSMATLPDGETYQLWASVHGQAISLGLLGQRLARGAAFSLGSSSSGAGALLVTVEPSGGVVSPDHVPIARASLTTT
ncbi:MAG: anti-sigma factor, partial [Acidimicrobiales bacterium]